MESYELYWLLLVTGYSWLHNFWLEKLKNLDFAVVWLQMCQMCPWSSVDSEQRGLTSEVQKVTPKSGVDSGCRYSPRPYSYRKTLTPLHSACFKFLVGLNEAPYLFLARAS